MLGSAVGNDFADLLLDVRKHAGNRLTVPPRLRIIPCYATQPKTFS
jgi:hypothetical protein